MITAVLFTLLFGASIFWAYAEYCRTTGGKKMEAIMSHLTLLVLLLFASIILGGIAAKIVNHFNLLSPN